VKARIARAYEFMKDGYGERWNVACCKNDQGACKLCDPDTNAYVLRRYSDNKKMVSNWVRFCPRALDPSRPVELTALTLWHELVHMTSRAGDSSYNKAVI